MYLQKRRPGHRVTLRRRENGFVKEDISSEIVSIRTDKGIDRAFGTFAIGTVPNDLHKKIKPDDAVLIELDGGFGFVPVMSGLVDRCSRALSHDDQYMPTYATRISGKDVGKLLVAHDCGSDLALLSENDGDPQARTLALGGWQFSGTPKENITDVMKNIFYGQMRDWVRDFFFTDLAAEDSWTTFNHLINQRSGTVWAAIKSLANEPWNIVYTKTDTDGALYLRLHQRPFLTDGSGAIDFKLIDRNEIDDDSLLFEDLGVGDANRVNYVSFENYVNTFGNDGQLLAFQRYNEHDSESMFTYGFSPLKPKTSYIPILTEKHENAQATVEGAIAERTKAIWDWYRRNHEYESGTIKIPGNPIIAPPSGVVLKKRGFQYFVEHVSQRYEVTRAGTTFSTSLALTRGQKDSLA